MGIKLFGGLALFLFGLEQMSDSLKLIAGERLKAILGKLTTNRFMGVITGAFVTAIIQSSSVTTVLVVGFISAGLLSLSQSIGIIMGANIGTTITAQIIAFKVTKISLLIVGIGFSLLFFSKKHKIKRYGTLIMGLGLVFFGMGVMGDAMQPLRLYQPFLDLMIEMETPIYGILVGAAFTALIQSSSATTGLIIVLASQGLISLPGGIALAFGANIGTCVTAMLAAIGKPREAVRAAAVHVLFNIAGVVVWFMFIQQLSDFVMWMSPSYPELSGIDRLSAETPRQLANAHTIFNFANTFIFIGFSTQLARLVEKLIPDRALDDDNVPIKSKYLDEGLLDTTSLALDSVRLEVMNMGKLVQDMLERIMPAILSGNRTTLESIKDMDDQVDRLYEQIIHYMGQISKRSLTGKQTKEFLGLMAAISDLENIGDTIETNLVVLGHERIDADFSISKPTRKVLLDFQTLIQKALNTAIQAVSLNSTTLANEVIEMKAEIYDVADSAAAHQAQRLVVKEPNRIPAYTIEIDIIEKQKRIYHFTKRMAATVIERAKNID